MFVTRMSRLAVAGVVIGLVAVVAVAQLPAADPPRPTVADKQSATPAELIVGRWVGAGQTVTTYPPGKGPGNGPGKEHVEQVTLEFGKDGACKMVADGIPQLKVEGRKLSGTYTFLSDSEIEIEMKPDKPKKEDSRPVEAEKRKSKVVVTKDELTLTEAVEDTPRSSTYKRMK